MTNKNYVIASDSEAISRRFGHDIFVNPHFEAV